MTEKVKKTKAPAKPRAPRKTAAKKETVVEAVTMHIPTHDEIAHLAEQYWMERGRMDGGAEQDWLRAEQTLAQLAS